MATSDEWIEPGAFEVAPGVHRIPLPLPQDGLRAVNVYAIESDRELVLIDGGWAVPAAREALEAALDSMGFRLRDIASFLVTHIHRDHYTQAVSIRTDFGTRISLGAGERPSLDALNDPSRPPLSSQWQQLRECGANPLAERLLTRAYDGDVNVAEWGYPDDWLAGRCAIPLKGRQLIAVPTPGHTQGHVVFADAVEGLLFAGDHVLPHITPSIGYEPVRSDRPLQDYLHSLQLVLDMPDMRLLPAHGPVAPSVHARVNGLLEHHRQRLDASLGAVTDGARTAFEAAGAMLWTRRGRRFDDLDTFNQVLATLETAAHLDVLVARGHLSAVARHGVVYYS